MPGLTSPPSPLSQGVCPMDSQAPTQPNFLPSCWGSPATLCSHLSLFLQMPRRSPHVSLPGLAPHSFPWHVPEGPPYCPLLQVSRFPRCAPGGPLLQVSREHPPTPCSPLSLGSLPLGLEVFKELSKRVTGTPRSSSVGHTELSESCFPPKL